MIKTVNDLIRELSSIKEELRSKPIYVIAENGLKFYPDIKFVPKELGNFSKDKDNVIGVLLVP